ncbi:hypothetical protein QCA50_007219 [Cerrena zonata]|uniref:Amino acid permease/ SLC12A domain-containing protein n=1 Tax=Cerrena zonata TaxID=2478898 RepID=A0AAW0GHM2_9APHY
MTARCDIYWQMYLLQEATSGRHDALLYVHIGHGSVFDSNTSLSFPTMTSYYREDGIRHRTKYPSSTPRKVQFVRPVPSQLNKQRLRIQKFQRRWNSIKQDLPPQLSRRHIGMISIGGVIGTGLFLGSESALRHGGPLGALLGYSIVGSVVYCLCVSVGEMIAFLPNVGGMVGLADLYVDRALGFSLGWAAWYNWSVTLPAEISAAVILVQFWDKDSVVNPRFLTGLLLISAVSINCFSSRVYGELEFWFSTLKVATIVIIILVSLVIDFGASTQGPILFKNWKTPFSQSYLGIEGSLGRFLGFWAVLMQASFSFSGSEVPGIAAGEVHDATRNVPRALRRVWIRITLFYIGGIFCAGLLVSADDPLLRTDDGTGASSPFVIALGRANIRVLPHFINAAILLSAWSAAVSDIYVSSRCLFFLARRGHAPQFLAYLVRYPLSILQKDKEETDEEESDETDSDDGDLPNFADVIDIRRQSINIAEIDITDEQPDYEFEGNTHTAHLGDHTLKDHVVVTITEVTSTLHIEDPGEPPKKETEPWLVLPLAAVLVSSSVGLLSFLGSAGPRSSTPQAAFDWLVAATSVASIQSWAGILFTYIRWHQGTISAERTNRNDDSEQAKKVIEDLNKIKEHRHRGQPFLAVYAFCVCIIVLVTNGGSVFIHGDWKIAEFEGDEPTTDNPQLREAQPVSQFLSSYIPIACFLLLTFGYKLIHQTKMVELGQMSFARENVPEPIEKRTKSKREGFLKWLLVI